jgi:hypothetical protein
MPGTGLRICGQSEAVRAGFADAAIDFCGTPTGAHGGFQALRIALESGAPLVLLLGYDCRQNGRRHFYERTSAHLPAVEYERWVEAYDDLADDEAARVINCTPDSAISRFRREPLQGVLP